MLSYAITIVTAVSVVIGLLRYHLIKRQPIRWLIIYLGISCLSDLAFLHIPDPDAQLTRVLYCLMIPIEYIIYVGLFKESDIQPSPFKRNFYYLSSTALALFGLYQAFFNFNQRTAATDVFKAMGVLTLIVVLLYFWAILRSNQVLVLGKDPLFWIATALLFFYTGNIIATGFYHILYAHSHSLANKLYFLNYTLNIVRYSMYSVAFIIMSNNGDER